MKNKSITARSFSTSKLILDCLTIEEMYCSPWVIRACICWESFELPIVFTTVYITLALADDLNANYPALITTLVVAICGGAYFYKSTKLKQASIIRHLTSP
ncbi:MAG: hypothetical protein ACKOC0_04815, partial [Cytophagales bacterium]